MADEAGISSATTTTTTPASPSRPKREQFVDIMKVFMIISWCATASIGCYGFYLGWDTKSRPQNDFDICAAPKDKNGTIESCTPIKDDRTICNYCHERGFDPVMVLISFYMVIFGVVGLAAECKMSSTFKRFGFLTSRLGRGLFLMFIGTLACAEGYTFFYTQKLTVVCGAVDIFVGFCCFSSYLCVKSGNAGDYHTFPGERR